MVRPRKPNGSSTHTSQGPAAGSNARELLGTRAAIRWVHSKNPMDAIRTLAAAVAAHPDTSAYIRACIADPDGLPARIFADLYPGARPGAAEVQRHWHKVFPHKAPLIRNPYIAFGFVDVLCDVWRRWQQFTAGASSGTGGPTAPRPTRDSEG